MKKTTLSICLLIFSIAIGVSQNLINQSKLNIKDSNYLNSIEVPTIGTIVSVNPTDLLNYLGQSDGLMLNIPFEDGKMHQFKIQEASVFQSEQQNLYPEIRSYSGVDINNPGNYLRFSVSPYNGFNGIVLTADRSKTQVIQNIKNTNKSIIYQRSNRKQGERF